MSLLPKRKPVDLEFTELSYFVSNSGNEDHKYILKNISGMFHSGHLAAIMGPSGAGKTTLMNILAGYRVSNVQGSILINGKSRDVRNFRKMACFIMQEDHHIAHFTVDEAMTFSCNLKLGNTLADSKKKDVINEILETLSLVDCRNTRTVNLSGGQKKRLSIAVELVNNPPIMFFDEPTSGLDSQNSFQCINLLKRLALDGRTIICTIHQPSARLFETFDYLYAISEGSCIYKGCVNGLLPFLSDLELECPSFHNPADFLIEVATSEEHILKMKNALSNSKNTSTEDKTNTGFDKLTGQNWKMRNYLNSVTAEKTDESASFLGKNGNGDITITIMNDSNSSLEEDMFVTSQCSQFLILLKRNFVSILRDSMLTKLRIMSHIGIGLLIGGLYYNIGNQASKVFNNTGLLFCCILFNIFAGMMPTLLTFPLEMKVFVREHHNCWYSLKAYYMAKTIADIPFQILYPIMYVLIVYFLSNQPMEFARFFMFTVMCVLTSLVAQSFSLAISAGMEIQNATFFAPIVSIPILLFSGFFVSFESIPLYMRWLTYISYMRYGFEGITASIYGYGRKNLDCSIAYCHFKSPMKYLQEIGITDHNFWVDVSGMLLFFVVFRLTGYLVLRWRIRCER